MMKALSLQKFNSSSRRSNVFVDPIKEYSKPNSIEIKINGEGEFPALETVMKNILNTLDFKLVESIVDDDFIQFIYKPKGKRSK